jgi:dipeptidase
MPFYAGALDLPESLQRADILKLDQQSMWTAFNYVANYSMLKYSFMIQDIHVVQGRYENVALAKQNELEAKALALWNSGDKHGARKFLTQYSDQNAAAVLKDWWKLSETALRQVQRWLCQY